MISAHVVAVEISSLSTDASKCLVVVPPWKHPLSCSLLKKVFQQHTVQNDDTWWFKYQSEYKSTCYRNQAIDTKALHQQTNSEHNFSSNHSTSIAFIIVLKSPIACVIIHRSPVPCFPRHALLHVHKSLVEGEHYLVDYWNRRVEVHLKIRSKNLLGI